MRRDSIDILDSARRDKRPVALATNLDKHFEKIVYLSDLETNSSKHQDIREAALAAFRDDRSRAIDTPDGRVFLHVFNPPLRLIVVGAVHIAQALVPIAEIAGYQVTVIDPRQAFATADRFPGTEITHDWPDDAMTRLAPDRRTAVVTLTHDPKLDDPALSVALRSEAFYIASLGSRRTHAGRLERLTAQGFSDADLKRIHGPAGLSLGARSPAEIALSIMGQATQCLRQGGSAAA